MTTRKEQKLVDNRSMASSFDSDQASILTYSGYSLQVVTTGTAVGTIRIYTSNDEEGISVANSSWDKLEGSEYVTPVAGSMTINIGSAFYGKIKLSYEASSGTGNMTVKFVGKD